jgi:hypothetical protein
MAQSANAAAPAVGTTAAPALASVPALAAVRADLDAAAAEGAALVAALDQRSAAGYAAHQHATATLGDIDAGNAQALAAINT